ncbi:MAG: hypothetical protein A3E36_01935 [Candidatus Andersenbacteria bacterium RIFCSPHIGHO2_12_FULL_45_11b]|uniref:Uncharacterized protein n=1 Tax=Candidatus Andersenbacteria bacterium RIFCSPHIGHO2_12_FULL_45_11b TaxID=1797282 RepID=A0A1G1X601_9BACT|nr:MAG: hypothetical protein A3E36_01935 [Candidatus Andersenbacteria bacterium RIFCSPHIGHO2_12_FULL_45_11b]
MTETKGIILAVTSRTNTRFYWNQHTPSQLGDQHCADADSCQRVQPRDRSQVDSGDHNGHRQADVANEQATVIQIFAAHNVVLVLFPKPLGAACRAGGKVCKGQLIIIVYI